jgi:hypothetical protein
MFPALQAMEDGGWGPQPYLRRKQEDGEGLPPAEEGGGQQAAQVRGCVGGVSGVAAMARR